MGLVFTTVNYFIPVDINKFDVLIVENDDKVEDGGHEKRLSGSGVEGTTVVVDNVRLWKVDGCGGKKCSDLSDYGVVKEIGYIEELNKFKLSKELKSLGPIKNVLRRRSIEVGSK
ncbi:hypothetical protein MA16_Dca006586 [Dendrobium catenatum]|uniref:Uncharacterized protein n=1 Tax=Dendrobium catenatum TaxID=906689 RepID=A0A2I0XGY6_9ASPA|nr:hypothetical protein MA16_Dca006586 [Dendrobium catenatum]